MSEEGEPEVKAKVVRNTTNAAINEIARTCPSFRPVEIAQGDKGAEVFYQYSDDYLYIAVFNFSDREVKRYIAVEQFGFNRTKEYHVAELWSGEGVLVREYIPATVAAKDVRVYRIRR